MASFLKVEYYSTIISQIRQGPTTNKGKNKAKPLLLWTIISLVETHILSKNMITLGVLNDRYYEAFYEFNIPRTVIIYPFFYLKNDGFWYLKWKNNQEVIIRTPTFNFIQENIDYAYLDEELWNLLQEKNVREKMKEVLIKLIKND